MKHLATEAAKGRVGDRLAIPSSGGFMAGIDAVIAERSMLQHPFYQAWTAGTLPVEGLREYARQYFHFEAAFPTFLSAVHSKCEPGPTRSAILGNLWDEESGAENHLALWLRFAEALGVSEAEVRDSEPNAETRDLVEGFRASCRDCSVAEGLATLYAYESQASDVAREKIAGLVRLYGMEEAGYRFFSVHQELDVHHAQAERTAIAAAATTEARRHLWLNNSTTQKTGRLLDSNQPFYALLSQFETLRFFLADNRILAEGSKQPMLVDYFPILDGRQDSHIRAEANSVQIDLVQTGQQERDLAMLTATGSVYFDDQNHQFAAHKLVYDHRTQWMEMSGPEGQPCTADGVSVWGISYNIKTKQGQTRVVGPAMGLMH